MADTETPGSQRWRSLRTLPSSEEVARAVAAAATAVSSPRPSIIFSSNDEGNNSPLKRIQNRVSKVLKGLSKPSDKRGPTYNPEVLTKQKRQWASFQLQSLEHRSFKEPSKLFESMVVVGLHPSFDTQILRKRLIAKKSEGSGKFRFALSGQNHSRVEPNFEPQVLFAYPPEKQLPLKYRDLLSFCFPGGIEVNAVEKNSSMSELNEILLGQDLLKQSEFSFVFRLQQVADNSTLYGCCVLVEELVDRPSRLISMISDSQPARSCLGRYMFTTKRCYCMLSRLPFFELHFGVLKSIFMEERLERLRKSVSGLEMGVQDAVNKVEESEENGSNLLREHLPEDDVNETVGTSYYSQSSFSETATSTKVTDIASQVTQSEFEGNSSSFRDETDDTLTTISYDRDTLTSDKDPSVIHLNESDNDNSVVSKPSTEKSIPGAVWPLLRYQQFEGSEPSSSFQGSSCESRHLRSEYDEADTEEASISGQADSSCHNDILEWAKANNNGSLQILCEYYKLDTPSKGSTITFHPLEHLHPLKFHRRGERVLHISGSPLDLRLCKTSLERAEILNAYAVEEEATALSTAAVACICGSLKLENLLTLFAGALLEKQIVFVCSNLGILSSSVLALLPLIRPYQWQSLLMPVLPNDMLDFLDAPVPYIVGVQSRALEVQSKLSSAILVDVSRNQVKSSSMPQLPKHNDLVQSLIPYHSKLVGESYLGRKRPLYECTEVQVEAAKGFLEVLRAYLDSLCFNLRSHTITNVQSNDDKVSLLLKESFIGSFPSRERPFMKQFVDTQMFSVHTDLVLSFYQKN
ncbi:uncharacterized protein LOC141597157 isoform X2 [Silene latifolia]